MITKQKPPIICSVCQQEHCAPCGKFATIDYKTRTGVCRGCAGRDSPTVVNSVVGKNNILTRNQADIDIVNEVYWGDCYGLRAMKQRGVEPKTIIDVGANIGVFSVLAHELWPNARMIAIEPNKKSFKVLQKNAPWATLHNVAIGSYVGMANLVAADGQPGSSFIADDDWEHTATWKSKADNRNYSLAEPVECDIFENILNRSNLDGDIDLLKIDCEGGEFPLLASLTQNIAARIRRIVGEYHHENGFDAFAKVARRAVPHLKIRGKDVGAIGPFWGDQDNSEVIDCYLSSPGIGDAICGVYAASGLASMGHRVRLHSKHTRWLERASFPNLQIITSENEIGIDFYQNYNKSLRAGTCRKQWYADNLARGAGIESFAPVAPMVDKTIHEKRIDFERYVLISPFSAWRGREWPAAHWIRLAYELHDEGYAVIAIDGVGDGLRLKETFSSTPAKWFWGQSPEWVTDAMLGAHAFIGNDSGMTHLAGMLGLRTIAIHAQVSPAQLWGYTETIPVFSDALCAGCSWQSERGHRQSCEKFGCSALMGIGPLQVLRESALERS